MSGNGGFKHRKRRLAQKRRRTERAAKANVARVKAYFDRKGQTWDPLANAIQASKLNHGARREVFGAAPSKK
jgi:hypothetical protein